MTEGNSKEFEMAVGTSNVLDSTGMMEGANYYSPLETNESESPVHSNWSGGAKADMGQLCRSCANSSDYLIPIYEGEGLEHQLEFKIQKHLPIQVALSDTLPLQLCYQCASTLIAWDSMITSCIEADKKLRAMQEAAVQESKTSEMYEDSQSHVEEEDNNMVDDSDDEPLIKTKAASEKTRASPIKKKILSKAKSKAAPVKNKTATNSKDDEVDEEERQREDNRRDRREIVSKSKIKIVAEEGAIDVKKIKRERHPSVDCKICKETLPTETELKRHVKNVHAINKVKCNICNTEIARRLLQKHTKEAHGLIPSQKDNNEETENKSKGVSSEVKSSSVDQGGDQESLDPCEVLCKVEMNETGSEGEKNVNLNFQGVECKICNQTYSNELNLKKHVYNVHKMVRVKCHVCDKVVNKKSLDRHMRSVHSAKIEVKRERKSVPEEEKIPCVLCNKKCLSLMSLKNHIKNIHEAEQFKCTQCDFQGIRKQMEKHMKKQHSDEVYQCTRCQKILKSKSTLKEHMWIHTDHRRFICDICGMRFKRTSNYYGHLKSHQEKKFQCQLCGNFFLRKRYLAVHEQTIHNYYGEGVPPQEKGFQCEVCGVKLKWKNNLLAHMRIHTGEKPYKCKICGDDFTCHGSLRTHMAKHAICPEPSEVSSIFIQQAYLENRTEPTVPFVPSVFSTSGDSVMQST